MIQIKWNVGHTEMYRIKHRGDRNRENEKINNVNWRAKTNEGLIFEEKLAKSFTEWVKNIKPEKRGTRNSLGWIQRKIYLRKSC